MFTGMWSALLKGILLIRSVGFLASGAPRRTRNEIGSAAIFVSGVITAFRRLARLLVVG
jgi:hypothetical protein